MDQQLISIKQYFAISGYDDEAENTWEPVDNLDCDDKIQDFEKKHKVRSFHDFWLRQQP